MLDYLYEEIYKMFEKDIYSYSIISDIYSKLSKYLYDYQLDIKEKIDLINNLLKLLKTNERKTANLKAINLSSNSGILYLSLTLNSCTKLVYYSYTGLKKQVLYEVK